MNHDTFSNEVEAQFKRCKRTLIKKAEEYAKGDDRLEQFYRGAEVLQLPPTSVALSFGMKHITSIADMVKDPTVYSPRQWNEKIGDAINYLVFVRALVTEALDD